MRHDHPAPTLDAMARSEVLALVGVGCSRRAAARYVGCSLAVIAATAQCDAAFALRLARAEQKSQLGLIKSIRDAAVKAQQWRAAAWSLERTNPEDFAVRAPDAVTVEQMRAMMEQLAQILVEHIPAAAHRKAVLRAVHRMTKELS